MDTSETYIKMCEKAEELQGQRGVLAFVPHGHEYRRVQYDYGDKDLDLDQVAMA